MKTDIHPKYLETKVHCNGCGTDFTTHSTVDAITVEICSNCHPFYTGKQKLVDVAGRVDRFKAHQAAAASKRVKSPKAKVAKQQKQVDSNADLRKLKDQLATAKTAAPEQ